MIAVAYPRFDGTQACAQPDVDPETFFGDGERADHSSRVRAALALCTACVFREPCAAYALTHDVRGIWGGTTEPTRREIQHKHGIKPSRLELPEIHTRIAEDSA